MEVKVVIGDCTKIEADALIVNLFEGVTQPGGATGVVDKALDGAITQLIAAGERLWLADTRRAEAERREKSRVLVVNDSVTTRLLEKGIRESNGYGVTLAVDGVDALAKLAAHPIDLVVSDVEMPRMNGFDLTRQLRREERHRELPVIVVTSLSSEEDKRTGIEAGADAYITKGAFDQGNLLATIRQLL